jgi:hypothetical protein
VLYATCVSSTSSLTRIGSGLAVDALEETNAVKKDEMTRTVGMGAWADSASPAFCLASSTTSRVANHNERPRRSLATNINAHSSDGFFRSALLNKNLVEYKLHGNTVGLGPSHQGTPE